MPAVLGASKLNTPDLAGDVFATSMVPGACAADAPVISARGDWLLAHLRAGFTLLTFGMPIASEAIAALADDPIGCTVVQVGSDNGVVDRDGLLARRYDARPGTCYLFRPDQHVCARWRAFDLRRVRAAITRASANVDVAMSLEAA